MRRNRKKQSIIIMILCLLVCSLTIGFAAFSNSLTISSSAEVKPDSSDFDINVYGVGNAITGGSWDNLDIYTSTTISEPDTNPSTFFSAEGASVARISDDGKNITVSDLTANFSEPGQSVGYYFVIKNEGEYDAYLNMQPLEELFFGVPGVCTAYSGTTPGLVEQTCPNIGLSAYTYDSEFLEFIFSSSTYKLEKGDYIFLLLYIDYFESSDLVRADGDFSVRFSDITFDFTSVPPVE